jgi:hypothetical protein
MTTLTGSRHDSDSQRAVPAAHRLRRRNAPLAVTGALLVAGCAVLFAAGWLQAGHRQPVLALARSVTAGQVLSPADLTVVRVSAAGPVSLLPAAQESAIVGRPAATTLPAGSLLTPAEIGAASPAPGQEKLGVAVKVGQYPPDLSEGQIVDVLSTPAAGSTSASSGGADDAALPVGRAVVLSVAAQASSPGVTVVELQMPQAFVPQVAAAAANGLISLVTLPAGG